MNKETYKWIALASLLLLFAAALYILRPLDEGRLTRVTVMGVAESKVAPDTAEITFSVVTQGTRAIAAQQESARKSEALRTAVEALATDARIEVKTGDYRLQPQYSYDVSPARIRGYEVRNTITVSVGKLDMVGNVVDAATAAGANSVDGIQFIVGQESPAQGEGVASAAKQAMAKADAVAASLGGRVVRIVQSTEGSIDPVHVQASYNTSSNIASGGGLNYKSATPIASGTLDVRSQVVLVVDIEIQEAGR
ncbi:MAG: SIMPL domain-containing protein [Blastocatellia bacterium]|nr:SIMPL domain-containing protein [Blastocatellia bacterium]